MVYFWNCFEAHLLNFINFHNSNSDPLTITLGDHTLYLTEKSEQIFRISKQIPHQEYNPSTMENDIMLIELMVFLNWLHSFYIIKKNVIKLKLFILFSYNLETFRDNNFIKLHCLVRHNATHEFFCIINIITLLLCYNIIL